MPPRDSFTISYPQELVGCKLGPVVKFCLNSQRLMGLVRSKYELLVTNCR